MRDWLLRQNAFTRWTAFGMAASAVVGIGAVSIFIATLIAAFALEERTAFGSTYPKVLDPIGEATLYMMGISLVSFLIRSRFPSELLDQSQDQSKTDE